MIFPGTIAQRYGLDLAVRALPLIKGKIPDIRLVIIGQRTQYADELEALAEECGVSSHLSILPTLPVEEIPGQVLRADVGIYPAHRDAHMDIAIPSKVLEFAILGIPIVSSRLTVMQQLFSDSAVIYFDPGNIEQFADCILALYQYPSLGREMVRRAGHEFNSRYDFHKEQAAYIDLLKRMLAPSGLTLPASKESP